MATFRTESPNSQTSPNSRSAALDASTSTQPFVFSPTGNGSDAPPGAAAGSLVSETRREISEIVREVALAARSTMPAADFLAMLADRTLRAMAADGVVVWESVQSSDDRNIQTYQVTHRLGRITDQSIPSAGQATHQLMLTEVAAARQPIVVPATPGANDPQVPTNPTDSPAAVVPIETLSSEQSPTFLLEVFLEPGGGVATQRGYLRFVAQMADLAGEFLRADRLREAINQEVWRRRIDDAIKRFHETDRREQLHAAVVDTAAELFGFARVGLCIARDGEAELLAVSHVERIDAKAPAAEFLVDAAYCELDKDGFGVDDPESDADANDQSLMLSVVVASQKNSELRLVCLDQKSESPPYKRLPTRQFRGDIVRIIDHAALAIHSVSRLDAIPGGRYLASLAPSIENHRRSSRTRWIAGLAVMVLIAVAALFPIPHVVTAQGILLPLNTQYVCAPRDVTVQKIHVGHGDLVAKGDNLVTLTSRELEQQLTTLDGEIKQLESTLVGLRYESGGSSQSDDDRSKKHAEPIKKKLESKKELCELIKNEIGQLTVKAEFDGRVDAWEIDELTDAPLNRGAPILQVFRQDSQWAVKAFVPENRARHLDGAEPENVRIAINSLVQPGLRGSKIKFGPGTPFGPGAASPQSASESPMKAVQIEISHQQPDGDPSQQTDKVTYKPGAPAEVMFDCGTAPAGYLLFQDPLHSIHQFTGLYFASSESDH